MARNTASQPSARQLARRSARPRRKVADRRPVQPARSGTSIRAAARTSTVDVLAAALESPAEVERKDRIWRGQRARRLPHLAAVSTVAAGVLGWGAAEFLAFTGGVPRFVTAACMGGLTASVTAWLAAANHKQLAGWRARYLLAAAAATLWVTVAAWVGVGPLLLAAAAALDVALGAGWWRAHRPGLPNTAAPPAKVTSDDLTRYARMWVSYIGGDANVIPGSYLTDGARTSHGLSWTLQLKPGWGGLQSASARLEQIASGLRSNTRVVVVDRKPLAKGEQEDASQLRLQVVTDSPITDTVPWLEPRYELQVDDGGKTRGCWLGIGPYADGDGWAGFQLLTRNSVFGGFICGSTGYGKSGLLNGLVASARAALPVVTFYVDPKRNSSPELKRNASAVVTEDEDFADFTAAVERLVAARQKYNAYHDLGGFTPGPGWPVVLVVLDECDMFFTHTPPGASKGAFAHRWAVLAKTVRTAGVAILAASQNTDLPTFGGSELLRSSLAAGTLVALHTASNSAGALLPDPALPNPKLLPADPGYGYTGGKAASRVAPFRSAFLPSMDDEPRGFNANVALARYPDVALDKLSAAAFGPELIETEDRRERRKADLGRDLEAITAGALPELAAPASAVAAVPQVPVFPPAPTAPQAAARVTAPADWTRHQKAVLTSVLAALDAGHQRTADIVEDTGHYRQHVHKALDWLAAQGAVESPRQGVWRYTHPVAA